MTDNIGFFKKHYDRDRGWTMNDIPIRSPGGTEVQIGDNKYDITQGISNALTKKYIKSQNQ